MKCLAKAVKQGLLFHLVYHHCSSSEIERFLFKSANALRIIMRKNLSLICNEQKCCGKSHNTRAFITWLLPEAVVLLLKMTFKQSFERFATFSYWVVFSIELQLSASFLCRILLDPCSLAKALLYSFAEFKLLWVPTRLAPQTIWLSQTPHN